LLVAFVGFLSTLVRPPLFTKIGARWIGNLQV